MSDGAPADSISSEKTIDSSTTSIREPESSIINIPHRFGQENPQTNGAGMDYSRRGRVSVAVDPVALITTECITVTSAMRKHAKWAHSSVSAILGGSSSPMNPSLQSSRPSTPRDEAGSRKGAKSRSSSGIPDPVDDGGLANRWGLRGKKGKSMQDNPLMAGFGRLRRELANCKGMGPMEPLFLKYMLTKTRHTSVRYPFLVAPFPPSHSSFCDLRPYHLSCACSYHEILLL